MKYGITRMQLIALAPARVWGGVASMDCDLEGHWPCFGLRPAQHLAAFPSVGLVFLMEAASASVNKAERNDT
jgi:hypothetical protein